LPRNNVLGREPDRANLSDLLLAADEGDPGSRRIIAEAGQALGAGVAIMANLFNPERAVVGGGLVGARDLLFAPMRSAMELGTVGSAVERMELGASSLGADASRYGALRMAVDLPA